MRVLIIGSGAIGLGIGAFLLNSKEADVSFLARDKTYQALKNQFRVYGILGEYDFYYRDYYVTDNYFDEKLNYQDWVLITTKTYANLEVRDFLKAAKESGFIFGDNTKILIIQNGWGNSELYRDFFGEDRVFTARIITGFVRESLNQVKITVHADKMRVGNIFKKELSKETEKIVYLLNKGGFDVVVDNDVDKYLWAKLHYNIALNPLSALFKVPYGYLAETEYTRELMNNLIRESFKVMESFGFSTFWDYGDFLKEFYEKMVPVTYDHLSSMLQDIEAKKPTEIDSFCGVIIKMGEEKGIDVRYNRIIYNQIKFLEWKNRGV